MDTDGKASLSPRCLRMYAVAAETLLSVHTAGRKGSSDPCSSCDQGINFVLVIFIKRKFRNIYLYVRITQIMGIIIVQK